MGIGQRTWRFFMTPVGRRVPIRRGRGAPHGMALLVVMVGLALMSAVVTDLGSNEMIRYRLASNDRDALKAQALADSGLNLSRLVLAMQSAIQPCITQLAGMGMPLPAHTFWQLIPLDSEIIKGMVSGEMQSMLGLDVSRALEERKVRRDEALTKAREEWDPNAEGAGSGPFEPPEGGFGLFDGSFRVEIVDEEQKAATLRGWAQASTPQQAFPYAMRLFNVMQPERYDFLFEDRDAQGNRTDRYELVAALRDWVDADAEATDGAADATSWGRMTVGSEDAQYSSGYKVLPKNAYFDSPGELRLVRGMTDAHLRAFGDRISIYGEGKINLLSAPDESIEALVFACAQPGDPLPMNAQWMAETLIMWREFKTLGPLMGGGPINAEGFISVLDARGLAATPTCKDMVTTESLNFTVKAIASVGDVNRTVTTVMRVYRAQEDDYYYAVR